MAKPLVAIVGRPNVGKSTFFNKMIGRRAAIVEDTPGVTRDRIYEDVEWRGFTFTLIDTGGIDPNTTDVLLSQMRRQAEIAIDTCDLILFMVDARSGLTADDQDVADMLRRAGKPVLLIANKADTAALDKEAVDFYELGLGDPIPVSSTNQLGLGDLLDAILSALPGAPLEADEEDARPIRVAVVGKPNAGKSSLVNKLLGQERVMVSDIPGTTRDAIDTEITANGQRYLLIDTAGIRRKRAIEDGTLERYSVLRAIAAIRRCDVALLMIDAADGVTEQDAKIAGLTLDEGRALVVAVNKWDLVEKETRTLETFEKTVREQLKFAPYARVLFISAKTGQRTGKVFETVREAYDQSNKRVTTGSLNDLLADAQIAFQPPASGGRRLKIYYATQPSVAPPMFLFFVNDESLVHFTYARYLENRLRKAFGFDGTPIKLIFRNRKQT
ncbi:MAG: ribosome biogenesis GTPase Der [Oscillospiraceae bacterium]|jgi:GTP-binding protein|nr:ribosome biogenesis GTPase Der [Oscillospiraceae bacterium]